MSTAQSMLSIELVPRDLAGLVEQADQVCSRFSQFEWLNIPDIRRVEHRSHDAAIAAAHLPLRVIPHIRARDRTPNETVEILHRLVEAGVHDALIVTGDRFDQEAQAGHPTALDALEAARAAGVPITLWAAFDPYRGELKAEFEYARAKIEAGAQGLFTQPFFDLRLAEICLDQLHGCDTFLGISPVTSAKSCAYWERTNRVVFPPHFEATLEYCARLTADLIQLVQSYGQHAYLMPIRVDPLDYLERSFDHLALIETAARSV